MVIAKSMESFPQRIAEILACSAQGDAAGVRLHAHTLKGAAATIAANILSNRAAEIEKLAKAQNLSGISAALPGLEVEAARLRQTLLDSGWCA